jgi:hypothetical protein
MCFSATVSFAAAATTGLLGAVTLTKVFSWQEKSLATIPLIFASQQAMEGGQWLVLGGVHIPIPTILLTNGYAFLAFAIWPVYLALAVTLVEQNYLRRLFMVGLVALGAVVALYGVTHISFYPYEACIVGHSISYSDRAAYPHMIFGAYLAAGCLPPILSSNKTIRWLGEVIIIGLITAWIFYFKTRFSVWCFFSALASATIYLHFDTVRRPSMKMESNLATQQF